MNRNYNMSMRTSSLKTMSAVRVALQIIETRKMPQHSSKEWVFPGKYEYERIKELNLLPHLKNAVRSFIVPMLKELKHWHKDLHFNIRPSWTPYGSIDVMRSMETFLEDETVESRVRYLVACNFCHEKYVFGLGEHLNKDLLSIHRISLHAPCFRDLVTKNSGPLVELWLEIIHAHRGLECPDQQLLQQLYVKGIEFAVASDNDFACGYFIGKASTEDIIRIVQERPGLLLNDWTRFSPSTLSLLFSKLNVVEKGVHENYLSFMLLKSLLKWPYQQRFMRVAKKLIVRLTDPMYFSVLRNALVEAVYNNKAYNYRGVIAYVLKLGAARWRSSCSRHHLEDILNLVIRLRDNYITSLFVKEVSRSHYDAMMRFLELHDKKTLNH